MTYQHYSPEFKARIVLQVLQGEKELGEVAKEHNINPNLIRKWRTTFLEKASMVFEDPEKGAAKAKRKEESLEKKQRRRTARTLPDFRRCSGDSAYSRLASVRIAFSTIFWLFTETWGQQNARKEGQDSESR